MHFATADFLSDNFNDPDGVIGVLAAEGFETPQREAVRKWFSRASIPSDWLPVLIVASARQAGPKFKLDHYVRGNGYGIFG